MKRMGILSNRKDKLTSKLLLLFMILIILGYFLRDSFTINIPSLFFFIVYILGFLVLRRDELLLYYLFLIPLSNGPLLFFLNVIFPLFYLIKNFNFIKLNKAIYIPFVLIIWEGLHLLPNITIGYDSSIIKFLGFALCIIVTSIVISNYNLNREYLNIIFSWSFGFISLCFILLAKYINNYGISNFTTIVRRFGWVPSTLESTSTTLLINPNALGKLVILTVFSLLTILKYEKNYSFNIIILIIPSFIFGLISGSRSFLLVFMVLLLLYLTEIIVKFNKNRKVAIATIIIVIITILLVATFMEDTLVMISNRFQAEDISGSRFDIYTKYINILKNSIYLIVGSGMQDYNLKYNIQMNSHNFFIETVSIWGVIGLIIVFLWFFSLYNSLNLKKNLDRSLESIIPYLPLIGLFLYGQTGQFFISYYDTFPTIIIAFLNIKYAKESICDSQNR